MTPVPDLLIEAARDRSRRGATLAVLIELHTWLDERDFRTVTAWAIAARLHISDSTVYYAIDELTTAGYIERGKPTPSSHRSGVAQTFRLKQRTAAVA